MEISPELAALGTELATIAGKKSVEGIFDKIRAIKQAGNKDETIRNLEEIINELIEDKNSLIQISRAYEEKLINQKITDAEIEYITDSLIPLIEQIISMGNSDNKDQLTQQINAIKSICSKETINILQILGFNFKKAIGEPLTNLVASLIESKSPSDKTIELQITSQQKEIEWFKVVQDEQAFKNLMSMMQKLSVYIKSKDEKWENARILVLFYKLIQRQKCQRRDNYTIFTAKEFNLHNSVNYIKSEDEHYSIQVNQVL